MGVLQPQEDEVHIIEVQGRGTLHCHILVWLQGNLSPQALWDKMKGDGPFSNHMFQWIESIISCELLGMTDILHEQNGPIPQPCHSRDEIDPHPCNQPVLEGVDDPDFPEQFKIFVNELAIECNWHEHKIGLIQTRQRHVMLLNV
jgi:hypothetical protein